MKKRLIKFRAWLPTNFDENGEEVYEMVHDLAFEEFEPINDLLNGIEHLMQYTGVDDMNGRNIYEGDFVQFINGIDEESIVCTVVWHDTMWCLRPYEDGPGFVPTLQFHIEGELSDGRTVLVVGNIYETPGMLETP